MNLEGKKPNEEIKIVNDSQCNWVDFAEYYDGYDNINFNVSKRCCTKGDVECETPSNALGQGARELSRIKEAGEESLLGGSWSTKCVSPNDDRGIPCQVCPQCCHQLLPLPCEACVKKKCPHTFDRLHR